MTKLCGIDNFIYTKSIYHLLYIYVTNLTLHIKKLKFEMFVYLFLIIKSNIFRLVAKP